APTATITSLTNGASFDPGRLVTIAGTASDVGGLVAGVEVSTDGGTTWHPATGTTNWSYSWAATDPGAHTIEARAIDDSVNSQATPSTVNLTVNGTTAPSLFSASSTPTVLYDNDASQIEVGMKFSSTTAGRITALKFYRSAGDNGPDVLDLWTATGTKLASVTFTNTAARGWQTVPLASDVAIAQD
ncbi:DUF4082 domain-containing protein, partial [Rhizobiaceae sp. 2RAB30]